jgi:hypothetical protein
MPEMFVGSVILSLNLHWGARVLKWKSGWHRPEG